MPSECQREEELIKAAKITPQQRRNWRMDMIRENDAKRVLLLSRDLNQRRGAVPGLAGEGLFSQGGKGPEAAAMNTRRKKDADVEGRRRWR